MNLLDTESSKGSLVRKLSFETLLSEMSAQFINLPAEQVDGIIEDAQRRICEALGFDMSTLWQWSEEKTDCLILTHLHSPPDGPQRQTEIIAGEVLPWTFRKVMEGLTIIYNTEDITEGEALRDRETRRYYGIKSSVVVPLKAGNKKIFGAVAFSTLSSEFNEESIKDTGIVPRLELLSQIFSNALLRKNFEMQLTTSELRLNLAADSAGAGLWEYSRRSRSFWMTDRTRAIFGFSPDETISLERFEDCVLPEDLPLVRKTLAEAFASPQQLEVEYRIRDVSGTVRWLASKGRQHRLQGGATDRLLGVTLDIHRRKCLEEALRNRLEEVEALKRRLEGEAYYLREDLAREQGFEQIIGSSTALKTVLAAARQVALTDATVLLLGETGSGKGLLAHAIHQMSSRKDRPMVTVNCAALPNNLIESELFGREKGAFTGAHARQAGRFEVADRGTIFLDEIGEMPLELQAKLLRVLQDGEFERLGSARTIKVDVRIIAATAQDLRVAVRNGQFRQDLFYRLNVFPITIPPLRDRTEDIVLLAHYFAEKFARKMSKKINSISKAALSRLLNYDWPGNVRELEHVVERSVIISPGTTLIFGDQLAPVPEPTVQESTLDLASVERRHIIQVMRQTNWKIEGSGGAAAILGLHPSTLRFRLKKMGIQRPV
jgi:formate hydrogenlyase transcriptional activator